MTRRIALNIGSIICSCVSTQKGTILKAIIVDFLNLLNRVTGTMSFFFVSDLIYSSNLYLKLFRFLIVVFRIRIFSQNFMWDKTVDTLEDHFLKMLPNFLHATTITCP